MRINTQKLHPDAILPKFQTEGAAAVDLHAVESYIIPPQSTVLVRSGLAFEIPEGFVGLVCSRSGLALKSGIIVLNAPGVIDSDYRGDVGAALHNVSDKIFEVKKGDRIAQFMVLPCFHLSYNEVASLSETERGTAGFGSTGV